MTRHDSQRNVPDRSAYGPTDGVDAVNPSAQYTPDYMPAEVAPTGSPEGTTHAPSGAAHVDQEIDDQSARDGAAPAQPAQLRGSIAGGAWAALILGAVLLILLLVFILQNQQPVEVNLFAWSWQFPAGVAYLFSAISGALIMALVGGWRMFELRRQVRRANRGR